MEEGNWQLKQIADFFYLLVDGSESSGKDVLQKRFKKDLASLSALYDLIERVDKLGYELGTEFAFNTNRFDTIKNTKLSLIEIRRFGKTWRVLTYWSKKRRAFVMLDAFEAHKHKSMNDKLKQVEPLVTHAARLVEDGE